MKDAVVARAFQSVTTLTSAGFPAAEVGGRARKNARPGGTVIQSRSYGLAWGLERPPGSRNSNAGAPRLTPCTGRR